MVNQLDSIRDYSHDNPQQHSSTAHFKDRSRTNKPFRFDDLLVTLANAHENRRALQVSEWERMRHQNFPAAV